MTKKTKPSTDEVIEAANTDLMEDAAEIEEPGAAEESNGRNVYPRISGE